MPRQHRVFHRAPEEQSGALRRSLGRARGLGANTWQRQGSKDQTAQRQPGHNFHGCTARALANL